VKTILDDMLRAAEDLKALMAEPFGPPGCIVLVPSAVWTRMTGLELYQRECVLMPWRYHCHLTGKFNEFIIIDPSAIPSVVWPGQGMRSEPGPHVPRVCVPEEKRQ
jgi:hypothetical protein